MSGGRTRLLVDAGLSVKETARRLALIDEPLESLTAVIISHEHSDHISGLVRLARRIKIPVYLSTLTATTVDWAGYTPKLETFQAGSRFPIGDVEVDSFTLPHDAIDPVGFCFRTEGIKIGLATDLGYIPDSVKFHLHGTNLLVLESNHDIEMLKVGPYPWPVKQRVMSRTGHLSNDVVGEFLIEDFDAAPATLVLGHLSEHNNHPEIVRMVATQALERRGVNTKLVIAQQKSPTEIFQW